MAHSDGARGKISRAVRLVCRLVEGQPPTPHLMEQLECEGVWQVRGKTATTLVCVTGANDVYGVVMRDGTEKSVPAFARLIAKT